MKVERVKEMWVVEYSVIQECFNISTMLKAMENNISTMITGRPNDYLIIGLFDSLDEARNHCDSIKKKIRGLSGK